MLNYLKQETNVAFTENGARVYKTTNSSVLDMFSQIGALRSVSEQDIINRFSKAYAEDKLLALKMLFYVRDIRGGQGERRTFRVILKYLATFDANTIRNNIELVSEYGRWDDLWVLFGTELEKDILKLMREQLRDDLVSETPSLLAKWMPSINTSSKETRNLAEKMRVYLELTPRQYRKTLSRLRKQINIVEQKMSANKWNEIEYSKLPSKAGLQYREAFRRHDNEGYSKFLDSLQKGEVKVNSSTLYPYELVHRLRYGYNGNDKLYNGMWENLPDYIGDSSENALCVVDVSASMSGLPMEVAISVGLYCAERLNGRFKNHFISFSESPELIEVKGSNFCERVRNIENSNWGYDTDLEAVFRLILNTAVKNKVPQSELPSRLFIISDMQFDDATEYRCKDGFFNSMAQLFKENGYEMPRLVFWNVDARNDNQPMSLDQRGFQAVSGCSPSIFKNLLSGKFLDAYSMMLEVLNGDRYNQIKL